MAASKDKGDRLEYAVVDNAAKRGIKAVRMRGSDGSGSFLVTQDGEFKKLPRELDVLMYYDETFYWLQCKNQESLPDYLFDKSPGVFLERSTETRYLSITVEMYLDWITEGVAPVPLADFSVYDRARFNKTIKPEDHKGIQAQVVTKNYKDTLVVIPAEVVIDQFQVDIFGPSAKILSPAEKKTVANPAGFRAPI